MVYYTVVNFLRHSREVQKARQGNRILVIELSKEDSGLSEDILSLSPRDRAQPM